MLSSFLKRVHADRSFLLAIVTCASHVVVVTLVSSPPRGPSAVMSDPHVRFSPRVTHSPTFSKRKVGTINEHLRRCPAYIKKQEQ